MEYGVIGERLGHSYSPEIHALIGDYKYEIHEVAPKDLLSFMREKNFKAINVTLPYKKHVMPLLDFVSDDARMIGAANTIVNRNGKLYGYNTDYDGMIALVRRMGLDMSGKKVVILGSGGTSKTTEAAARRLGAKQILRVSRKANTKDAITYKDVVSHHADADVVINTTPVGMYPNTEGVPINLSLFNSLKGVIDAVYNPLRTDFVQEAERLGVTASGGLYMLAAQAVFAHVVFFDKKDYDAKQIDEIYKNVLAQKQNIVLIGMPSCGKSSVGRALAGLRNRPFVDTDELIVKRAGLSIADFFAKNGEAAFRELETQIIGENARGRGAVIATGGGAVLSGDNVRLLKHNGVLVFVDRDIDKLTASDERPLASTADALKALYERRYDIYNTTCDLKVDGNGTAEETARAINEALK